MSDPLKPLFSGLGGAFAELARKAAATTSLTSAVQQSLPETLRPHVVSAVRRGDDLVVIVDSAAWSARVRYAGPRLRELLPALVPQRVELARDDGEALPRRFEALLVRAALDVAPDARLFIAQCVDARHGVRHFDTSHNIF
jgi:hypothetical protein